MLLSKQRSFFLIIVWLPVCSVLSQTADSISVHKYKVRPSRPVVRNVVWFEPTRARETNGLVLGGFSSSLFYQNDSLQINGMEVNAEPLAVYLFPYFVFSEINGLLNKKDSSNRFTMGTPDSTLSTRTNSVANGLYVGLLGSIGMSTYNGINISSILSFGTKLNGLSLTIGQNVFYNYRGMLIAGLMNKTTKGKGVQIALINRCKDCRGLQIGLLNTMGRRTFPFFNARF